MPRNRIVNDALLWELAAKKPQTDTELQDIDKLGEESMALHGDTLITLIKNVLDDDVNTYPELLPRPLSKEQNQLIKQLKAEVKNIASANQLAPELLMRKKDYERLLRSGEINGNYQLPQSLGDWRRPLLEERLLTLLAEKSALFSVL